MKRPSGEIRQSQILTTFGPGAMVDLPNASVLVGGLNHWTGDRKRIFEDRLAAYISEKLGIKDIKMYAPPTDTQDPKAPRTGITAFTFPTWFVAQVEETWKSTTGKEYRTRPLMPWKRLVGGKYLNFDKKKIPVVPVRFVQACANGHISDIDWYAFAHDDFQTKCRGQLWLDEAGSGNDFAEIFVRCEACKKRRPLSDATIPRAKVLGICTGHRPWIGPSAAEPCLDRDGEKPLYSRLLVRSASNAYFAQLVSVISLPDSDAELKEAVSKVYEDFLQYAEDISDVRKERKKQKVGSAIAEFSDEAVWAEIQRRQSGLSENPKTIKQVEIETLLSCREELGKDVPEGDFFARARKLESLNPFLSSRIERIVLVHRLREVMAQVGFTRFEAAMPDIEGELDINVRPAALDLDTTWVPALENRGEGVFIAFKKEAIDSWQKKKPVQERGQKLLEGFEVWRERKGIPEDKAKFPGLPYIMLHSLSHLLIAAVSVECGYAASSIRERVYAGEAGYGILLYTGSPDSEGTLGGLVGVGNRIEWHLISALELGRLCSNDPVCAQHLPNSVQEERFSHGSACHGCLLIAETSCERRNEFLDRALVVPTVTALGAEFFPDEWGELLFSPHILAE